MNKFTDHFHVQLTIHIKCRTSGQSSGRLFLQLRSNRSFFSFRQPFFEILPHLYEPNPNFSENQCEIEYQKNHEYCDSSPTWNDLFQSKFWCRRKIGLWDGPEMRTGLKIWLPTLYKMSTGLKIWLPTLYKMRTGLKIWLSILIFFPKVRNRAGEWNPSLYSITFSLKPIRCMPKSIGITSKF